MTSVGHTVHKLRQMLRGRYVRTLEEVVARQRADIDRQRADVEREREETDRARDEVTRERAELARERADSVRLREENRAMLNSLLGLAGVPPVEVPRAAPAGAPPIRRRSWPQVATTREIEAARKVQAKQDEAR